MAKRLARAGELRQRVTIQLREDSESGDYSLASEYTDIATVSAKVTAVSGVQQVDSRNAGSGISHTILIRYRADVDTQNELVYTGRYGTFRYSIETVQNAGDERNRFLLLDCNQGEKVNTFVNPSPVGEVIGFDLSDIPDLDAIPPLDYIPQSGLPSGQGFDLGDMPPLSTAPVLGHIPQAV